MADTIITNTPDSANSQDNFFGGVTLMIIIAVLAVGAVLLYQNGVFQTKSDTTEINVTVPDPTPTPAE